MNTENPHKAFTYAGILKELAEMFHANAKNKGFYDELEDEAQFIQRTCNNLHNEVSELNETHRNGTLHKPCDKAEAMKALGLEPLTCAEEEHADIVIQAFDSAERLGIDIGRAVAIKHAFNVTRPYKHGGKRA